MFAVRFLLGYTGAMLKMTQPPPGSSYPRKEEPHEQSAVHHAGSAIGKLMSLSPLLRSPIFELH